MSSVTYHKIEYQYAPQNTCYTCKFKSKYGWLCDCVFSPMKGETISYKTSCKYHRRSIEKNIR